MLTVVDKQKKDLNTLGTQIEPRNWEITVSKDKYYTCDEVLDAYLHGKKKGLENLQKIVLKTLLLKIKTITSCVFQLKK